MAFKNDTLIITLGAPVNVAAIQVEGKDSTFYDLPLKPIRETLTRKTLNAKKDTTQKYQPIKEVETTTGKRKKS